MTRTRSNVAVDPTVSAAMPAKLRAATVNVVTIAFAVDAALASKRTTNIARKRSAVKSSSKSLVTVKLD